MSLPSETGQAIWKTTPQLLGHTRNEPKIRKKFLTPSHLWEGIVSRLHLIASYVSMHKTWRYRDSLPLSKACLGNWWILQAMLCHVGMLIPLLMCFSWLRDLWVIESFVKNPYWYGLDVVQGTAFKHWLHLPEMRWIVSCLKFSCQIPRSNVLPILNSEWFDVPTWNSVVAFSTIQMSQASLEAWLAILTTSGRKYSKRLQNSSMTIILNMGVGWPISFSWLGSVQYKELHRPSLVL